jgi:hypothetical protein
VDAASLIRKSGNRAIDPTMPALRLCDIGPDEVLSIRCTCGHVVQFGRSSLHHLGKYRRRGQPRRGTAADRGVY